MLEVSCYTLCYIVSYPIVVLKRQNCLKVGTDKPKLKVKMQSVSDDDVRTRVKVSPICSTYEMFNLQCLCIGTVENHGKKW